MKAYFDRTFILYLILLSFEVNLERGYYFLSVYTLYLETFRVSLLFNKMSTCKICKAVFNGDKIVACVICLGLFHANFSKNNQLLNCAKINEDEDKIRSKQKHCSFVYTCQECLENGCINPDLKSYIEDLSSKLAVMESLNSTVAEIKNDLGSIKSLKSDVENIKNIQIPNINSKIENQTEDFSNQIGAVYREIDETQKTISQSVIKEINLRSYKAKNVLMLNLPDNNDHQVDNDNLSKILDFLKLGNNQLTISRIGQFKNNKFRPLIIKTQSADIASHILGHSQQIADESKKLLNNLQINKNYNEKIPVLCVRDKTKMEIAVYKEAKLECENRKRAGERVRIKYFNDIPTVVEIKDNPSVDQPSKN